MRRHPADLASLIAGLLLMAVGGAYLLSRVTNLYLDARWVAPVVLIGVGLAGLTGAVVQARRQH